MRDIRRVQKHLGKPAALFVALFVAIATFGLTTTAQAKEDFQAYWDNGIRLAAPVLRSESPSHSRICARSAIVTTCAA